MMYYGSVECVANDCYNSNLLQLYYNSNSLAIQQIGLKRNFLWRVAQIIGSEIIQTDDKEIIRTDDKVFPK